MRISLVLAIASALTGCGGSTAYVNSTDPCAKPVQLPERPLSSWEIEKYWLTDRLELLKCGDKVETLSGRQIQ